MRLSLLVFCTVLLSACTPKYLSEQELKKYVLDEDNGLRQSVQQGDLKVEVVFRPSDLLVLQELKGTTQKDNRKLSQLQKKYNGQYYFILNLSKKGKEAVNPSSVPLDDFSDVLQNVSFRMGEFVNATTSKRDTLALKDFLYNRTFGFGSSSEILLVFDKDKTKEADWLQVNLKELGLGLGNQRFRFDIDKLDNTPHIDFTKI